MNKEFIDSKDFINLVKSNNGTIINDIWVIEPGVLQVKQNFSTKDIVNNNIYYKFLIIGASHQAIIDFAFENDFKTRIVKIKYSSSDNLFYKISGSDFEIKEIKNYLSRTVFPASFSLNTSIQDSLYPICSCCCFYISAKKSDFANLVNSSSKQLNQIYHKIMRVIE